MKIEELPWRQRQIVGYLLRGYSRGEIADLVGIEKKTVDTLSHRALDTIGVDNDVQLFAAAAQDALEQVRARLQRVTPTLCDEILSPLDWIQESAP